MLILPHEQVIAAVKTALHVSLNEGEELQDSITRIDSSSLPIFDAPTRQSWQLYKAQKASSLANDWLPETAHQSTWQMTSGNEP